jgi:hypothetical protein
VADLRALTIAHCRRTGRPVPPEGSQEWDSLLNEAVESETMADAHNRARRQVR